MPQGIPISNREYRWRWWALVGASLAVFMSTLDNNVVNVALPILAREFRVSREIRWVVLSYVLPATALLGAFGALSDVVGRRRITLIGIALFLAGSVLCGTARSLPAMVVYRIIQGTGGSCVGASIMAIATVSFAREERGRAMAIVGLIAPLGAVVGPGLGGLLIGALGWPSIFYINVPFGLLSFALIMRLLPREATRPMRSFDFAGAALITVALVLLIMGLTPTGGRIAGIDFVFLAGSAFAFAALVFVERAAANPLVPPSLVRRPQFTFAVTGIMTMGIVGTGLGFLLPFFLEGAQGYGPARTGLTLLFFPLAMAVASQIGGRLTDRFSPRVPAAAGAVLALTGVMLFLPFDSTWTLAEVAVRLAVTGFGFGLFLSPSGVAAMGATPGDQVGVGGALINTARFLGFALGPTLATTFWSPTEAVSSMRAVAVVLVGVEVVTLATVLAFGAKPADPEAAMEARTTQSEA